MKIKISHRLLMYALVFGVVLAVWLALPVWFRPAVYSIPSGKVTKYVAQKGSYRLLFVGDSRTYTDIQPRVVGPLLGKPAYNLASFGLWLPVQYLEFREVFEKVPPDTVVVWSLSHHNFLPVGDRWWISGQYKFSLADGLEYALDGYPIPRVIREYEEAPFSPVDLGVTVRKKLIGFFGRTVWRGGVKEVPANQQATNGGTSGGTFLAERNNAAATKVIEELKRDRQVNFVAPVVRDGTINSVEATRIDGGYDRIIVDPAFFRKLQGGLWPKHSNRTDGCQFAANEVYMRTFEKILNLISRYRLRVIVNYIEDAPGSWSSDAERACAKQFMVQKIVPILARRGIPAVFPDLYPRIKFSNEWYFDHSHLHSEGAAIYSELLAGELGKVISNKGW
jgi:hypothetical protein